MSIIFLFSWPCVIASLITYDMSNQEISSMLNYTVPENTEDVRFGWNLLTHVQAGYFKNLPYLTHIWLWNNEISDINDFAFVAVPSVTYIHLGINKLSVIRKNMFSGLPHLSELALLLNMIHTIESGTFKDNKALAVWQSTGNPESMYF